MDQIPKGVRLDRYDRNTVADFIMHREIKLVVRMFSDFKNEIF